MTGDKDAHHLTTFSLPVKADTFFGKCWWSDEVFPGSQQGYRDFVLISEFSEMEGPVPLAVVSESTYVDLKEYTAPTTSSSNVNSTTSPSSSSEQRRQMETDLHALGLDRFDFNAFALRVVSTDRGADCYDQANLDKSNPSLINNTPATPSSLLDQTTEKNSHHRGIQQDDPDTGNKHNDDNNSSSSNNTTQSIFSIPDDTQVYFNDSDLKLYSFTHHLTLFDINARGYVHPVALSYITRDTEKIVSRFEDFMNRFNEVSRLMKKGNYANFMLDLKYRLLDLEFTERTINNANIDTPPTIDSNTEKDKSSLVSSSHLGSTSTTSLAISGTNDKPSSSSLKQQSDSNTITATPIINKAAISATLPSLDTKQAPKSRTPAPIDNRGALMNSPDSPPHTITTTLSAQITTNDNTTMKHNDRHPNSTSLPSTTSNNKHNIPTIDTDITSKDHSSTSTKQQQPPTTAPVTRKECLSTQALHQAQMVTRLMLDTMDTYATQWIRTSYDGETSEDLSTDLEEDSTTLFSDKQQIVESPQSVEPSKDYQPKYVDTLYPVPHFDRKLRSLSQLCHEPDNQKMVQQRRRSSNSGQSHRSLPSTSVIPLVSIIEPQRRKSNKVIKRRLFDKNTKHDMYTEAIKYITDLTTELGRSSVALEQEQEDAQFTEPISQAVSFGRVFMLNLEDTHSRHESSSLSSHTDDFDDSKSSEHHPYDLAPNQTTTTVSIEDTQLVETDEESSDYYSPLWPTAQLWESKQKQNYGNLLHLLDKHKQYIHHVIYSLLTGRSVVIIGHPDGKSRIQEIIHGLSIFVPGLSKQHHQIVPWYNSGKLKDESLAAIKLVGTAIENVDPSVYRMDISCLEVDHENGSGHLITSPLYLDGQWIYRILSKTSLYTVDESYIGYLHTMFMEMSLIAYLFYQKYIVETEDEGWDDGFVYQALTPSIDSRYTSKSGQHSSTTSHNGSPSEEHRQQLSKKWSVRRIMNYLKRVEDGGEPDDYFGAAGALTSSNNTANTSPNLIVPSTTKIPTTSNPLISSSSSTTTTLSTSSTRTDTSVSTSSSASSSSPFAASSLIQERLSALDDSGNIGNSLHGIPPHILSQLEATSTHQNHHRDRRFDTVSQGFAHEQPSSFSPMPPQQDETSSDHFSEENEATVTLENIQHQPHLSVTQLDWNPPSKTTLDKSTFTAGAAAEEEESTYNTAGSSRRTSGAFSDRSIFYPSSISISTSRRNSSSNTSTSNMSDDDDYGGDDGDTNTEPWRYFDTDTHSSSSSDDNDNHSVAQRRYQQKQQGQVHLSRKRHPDGRLNSSQYQSDTRSYSSERRGQTFLEQTFHVLGDDQAIVMYLANLNKDNNI
ncbi:hypothetical protein BC941DRAFT_517810 [Chlamydoabsidia padenii]|nr:hypothetical protein BC941DRAFT_517810 [Chlamydoabsidia padenii]